MTKRIIADVSDLTYLRLLKLKADQNMADKDWKEWFEALTRNMEFFPTIGTNIRRGTKELAPMWMRNFANNLDTIRKGKTLREIAIADVQNASAIVIGRGPSVFRKKHLKLLAESKFQGVVLATDGILIDCLKEGVVPDFVCSVDGSPVCTKWYDDPLVMKNGSKIKAVLCSQVSPKVVELVKKANMDVYWFHPSTDEISSPTSVTKMMLLMTCSDTNPNGLVGMEAGGNVGASLLVLSWTILKRNNVALIGLDYGYPFDMPLEETYYYDRTVETMGALKANVHYETVWHPYFKTESKIDPAFKSYREGFYQMLDRTPNWLKTYNCTEGGTLFHPKLRSAKFEEWLKEVR